jgi:hypothetical protein
MSFVTIGRQTFNIVYHEADSFEIFLVFLTIFPVFSQETKL